MTTLSLRTKQEAVSALGTDPLVELLGALEARGYHFVMPTSSTCRRTAQRQGPTSPDLRDIFGWNRLFAEHQLDAELVNLLGAAGMLARNEEGLRSRIRASTVRGRLFLHSAPASGANAVFLGPDSYRFADLIAREAAGRRVRSIVDVGTGAGVGGLIASDLHPEADVLLSDINPGALRLAAANAAHAGKVVSLVLAPGLNGVIAPVDLIVANPPYVAGTSGSIYKDGGDLHGARLSLDWVIEGLEHLAPGGRFILYTGSAILDGGIDQFRQRLEQAVPGDRFTLAYAELDPDIFSGELRREAYADVERIAAVGAVVTRRF